MNPDRLLTPDEIDIVRAAREKAEILYEGRIVAHRSCGICLAETFGLPWRPYEILRKGGLTGEGSCGAIRAGEMVIGELLAPEESTDPPPDRMRVATEFYQRRWRERAERDGWGDSICNTLTAPLGDFMGDRRKGFCTNLAAEAAEIAAEALIRAGYRPQIEPVRPES